MYDLPIDKIKFMRLKINLNNLIPIFGKYIGSREYRYYFKLENDYATLESLNGSDWLLNYTSEPIKKEVLEVLRVSDVPFSIIGE